MTTPIKNREVENPLELLLNSHQLCLGLFDAIRHRGRRGEINLGADIKDPEIADGLECSRVGNLL